MQRIKHFRKIRRVVYSTEKVLKSTGFRNSSKSLFRVVIRSKIMLILVKRIHGVLKMRTAVFSTEKVLKSTGFRNSSN